MIDKINQLDLLLNTKCLSEKIQPSRTVRTALGCKEVGCQARQKLLCMYGTKANLMSNKSRKFLVLKYLSYEVKGKDLKGKN